MGGTASQWGNHTSKHKEYPAQFIIDTISNIKVQLESEDGCSKACSIIKQLIHEGIVTKFLQCFTTAVGRIKSILLSAPMSYVGIHPYLMKKISARQHVPSVQWTWFLPASIQFGSRKKNLPEVWGR